VSAKPLVASDKFDLR